MNKLIQGLKAFLNKNNEIKLFRRFNKKARRLRRSAKHLSVSQPFDSSDRGFINAYISSQSHYIYGDVLEWETPAYAKLHAKNLINLETAAYIGEKTKHPNATYYLDLNDISTLPEKKFDCIIATQVLIFFVDIITALQNLRSMLKPNGVLILTTHGNIFINYSNDFPLLGYSAKAIEEVLNITFGENNILDVQGFGNQEYAFYAICNTRYPKSTPAPSFDPRFTLIVAATCKNQEETDVYIDGYKKM